MPSATFTDAELSDLYAKYAHVLFWRCRSIVGSDEEANDAVQETFARVLRHGDEFRQQSSPLTWMYRISTNYCLNQVRNRRGRQQKLDRHGDGLYDMGGEREGTEDHARILALLDGLDDETKACVIHTFFDDCTREEVASLVGISVPTVRKRVNQFLERARVALGAPRAKAAATVLAVMILAAFHLPPVWSLS